jgi:hypothetical protein
LKKKDISTPQNGDVSAHLQFH